MHGYDPYMDRPDYGRYAERSVFDYSDSARYGDRPLYDSAAGSGSRPALSRQVVDYNHGSISGTSTENRDAEKDREQVVASSKDDDLRELATRTVRDLRGAASMSDKDLHEMTSRTVRDLREMANRIDDRDLREAASRTEREPPRQSAYQSTEDNVRYTAVAPDNSRITMAPDADVNIKFIQDTIVSIVGLMLLL